MVAESVVIALGLQSYFAVITLQLMCIIYAYVRSDARGAYWNTLLAAAICGFIGILLASVCKIFVAPFSEPPLNSNPYLYIMLIFAEPFWIVFEFSIVICNYIKLYSVLSPGSRLKKPLNIIVILGALGFTAGRLYIGSMRFMRKRIDDDVIWKGHFYAWGCLFFTELFFSVSIVSICIKHRNNEKRCGNSGPSFFSTLLKSNLCVLLSLDILGCLLTALSFLVGIDPIIEATVGSLNILKSVFPLFLTLDAIFIKFENHFSTINGRLETLLNNESKVADR